MLHQLKIGLMDLVRGRFVTEVGLHCLEIGEIRIQVVDSLLVVCWGLRRCEFPLQQQWTRRSVWPILVAKRVGRIVIRVMIGMLFLKLSGLLLKLLEKEIALCFECWDLDGCDVRFQPLERSLVSSLACG